MIKKSYFLGVDVGGTKCAVIAGTAEMKILERIQFDTETIRGPEYAISKLLEKASSIVEILSGQQLISIGISCGGPLNSRTGIIQSPPNLPGWDNIEIVKIFNEKFKVPVFLQNDANACALAEWRFGAGKGTENMVFLTFGTGLGAGLILNGKLYTGTNDLAGEIGHIRLADDGPEAYGKKGSFEGFCSGAGIVRLARIIVTEKWHKGHKVAFCEDEKSFESLSTKDLAMAAAQGDETALEIFDVSAKYLGIGLSVLIDILNPQRIVIGSVYARNPQLFDKVVREIIEREALKPASDVCRIVPAALGEQIGDYACLSVAMGN
jgi:glucokinase